MVGSTLQTERGATAMKTSGTGKTARRHDERKAHLIAEERHDPYKARGKPAGPCVCEGCGAVFARGRWHWADTPPADAKRATCPACQRIADDFPAGRVTLAGAFLAAHRDEILALARNVEARARAEHPLQRIMKIAEGEAPGETVVTTTDIHLPRRIGHALVDAYKGDLRTHYDEEGYFARIDWRRD